jgi:hypothetical protein
MSMGVDRLALLIAAILAATLLVAACGDDDSSGEDADITEAIEQAATSDTAESCTEFQTLAFTEQTEFETGDAAIAACEGNAGEGVNQAADSVEVSEIEVDGDTATAEVAFSGAGLDNQVIAVSLLKEDDQWKLDSLDEFVSFDKEAYIANLVESAASDGDTSEEVLTCLEDSLGSAPDEELQTAFLSGDEDQVLPLIQPCFSDQ